MILVLTKLLLFTATYAINFASTLARDLSRCATTDSRPLAVAFIIPFARVQYDRVLQQADYWSKFEPFGIRDIYVRRNVHLWYYSDAALTLSERSELSKRSNGRKYSRPRWTAIHFYDAGLPATIGHVYGANAMFKNLFDWQGLYGRLRQYSYLFLMEPDTLPIRMRWASAVYRETRTAPFWQKGSIYFGDLKLDQFDQAHINGNAIYSTQSIYFRDLINERVAVQSNYGFDSQIFTKVVATAHFERDRQWRHCFVYSAFVRNMALTKYNATLIKQTYFGVYLMHGGIDISL